MKNFQFMYPVLILFVVGCWSPNLVMAQSTEKASAGKSNRVWEMQTTGCESSLRGLHVLSDTVVWASGTDGTVLRTVDGGANWKRRIVKGAEKLDFRDIHAFDANNAVILSAGTPARVYRTEDAGKTWAQSFEHKNAVSYTHLTLPTIYSV